MAGGELGEGPVEGQAVLAGADVVGVRLPVSRNARSPVCGTRSGLNGQGASRPWRYDTWRLLTALLAKLAGLR